MTDAAWVVSVFISMNGLQLHRVVDWKIAVDTAAPATCAIAAFGTTRVAKVFS